MFITLRSAIAREAVATAFAAFAPRHPTYVANLFDEHFLQSRVAPLLRVPGGSAALSPEWLAGAWTAQFDQDTSNPELLIKEATPVAADFIDQLIRALARPAGSLQVLQEQGGA